MNQSLPDVTQLGPYRIVGKLGGGGIGMVYEAVHQDSEQRVAIKALYSSYAADPQLARDFLREAYAVNAVIHPGVVPILDSGVGPDDSPYVVMELVQGETLTARLLRLGGRIPMEQSLHLAGQVAAILAAVHQQQLTYRDLSTDVLMITAPAQQSSIEPVRLLGFGMGTLLKMVHGQWPGYAHRWEPVRAGALPRNPAYLAPEQCRETADVNDRADVYAFGVLLYQLLAGRLPFVAQSAGETMALHLFTAPRPLGELNPAVSLELAELVMQLLDKSPFGRPAMAQVVPALARLAARNSA